MTQFTPTPPTSFIEYLGVQFSQEGVSHVESGRKLLFIPKNKIRQIVLRKGMQSERPVFQALFGFIVFVIGFYPIAHLLEWLRQGGTFFDVEVLMILLIPLGGWFIFDALKRGLYLEIILDNDHRKIPFRNLPENKKLEEFLKQVTFLEYVIDRSLTN